MTDHDDRTIARWRIHAQHLVGPPAASAPAVVGAMLAVQAENHAQASWALACRTSDVTAMSLAPLFDEGAYLRTHVLRPTWHYVRPEDIRWLLELTAPRIRQVFRNAQRELDLDDETMRRSVDAITTALSEGRHLTRDDLGARLCAEGLPATGRRLGTMLAHAELSALICSGAMDGTKHTYALLDERAPAAPARARDEALAELALRYFTGHGPATERDLAYWATLTLTDVRAGIASVRDRLDHVDHDGRTYWFGQEPAVDAGGEPVGHLLLILDEYFRGYQDSRWTLDADGLVPRDRPATLGMALVDGQMVGDVRRTIHSGGVEFAIGAYRDLDAQEEGALRDAAVRCGRFLDLEPTVIISPAGP